MRSPQSHPLQRCSEIIVLRDEDLLFQRMSRLRDCLTQTVLPKPLSDQPRLLSKVSLRCKVPLIDRHRALFPQGEKKKPEQTDRLTCGFVSVIPICCKTTLAVLIHTLIQLCTSSLYRETICFLLVPASRLDTRFVSSYLCTLISYPERNYFATSL